MDEREKIKAAIARAGKKNPDKEVEDLQKAVWYLNREISRLMAAQGDSK